MNNYLHKYIHTYIQGCQLSFMWYEIADFRKRIKTFFYLSASDLSATRNFSHWYILWTSTKVVHGPLTITYSILRNHKSHFISYSILWYHIFTIVTYFICDTRKSSLWFVITFVMFQNRSIVILWYYRVTALISVNIVPSWDIYGRELVSVRRYHNGGQYSPNLCSNPFVI